MLGVSGSVISCHWPQVVQHPPVRLLNCLPRSPHGETDDNRTVTSVVTADTIHPGPVGACGVVRSGPGKRAKDIWCEGRGLRAQPLPSRQEFSSSMAGRA
jgi:hypothetical protein